MKHGVMVAVQIEYGNSNDRSMLYMLDVWRQSAVASRCCHNMMLSSIFMNDFISC